MGFVLPNSEHSSSLFSRSSNRDRAIGLFPDEDHANGRCHNVVACRNYHSSDETQEVRLRSILDELGSLEAGSIIKAKEPALRLIAEAFSGLRNEWLVQILLDFDGRYVSHNVVCKGVRHFARGSFRKVVAPVIEYGAQAFVLVHNHPSGKSLPSKADIQMTKQICQLSQILDLGFLDHFIVSDRTILSMQKAGYL